MRNSFFKIFILLNVFLLFACGSDKDKAHVKGSFKNVQRAQIFFYSTDGVGEGIDTMQVERGDFDGYITLREPSLYTLLLQNFTEYSLILEPGKTITIQGDAQNLAGMKISGSEENELLTSFRHSVQGKSEREQTTLAADFIRKNAEHLAALAVMRDVFAHQEHHNPALVRELLSLLKKSQSGSRALRQLEQVLNPYVALSEGEKLPNFTAQTLSGNTVSSSDYKGVPLVIVFIATWTHNYNELMRTLQEVKREGPDNLRFLLVSLDTDIDRLRNRMETDSLAAPVVCEGKAFTSTLWTALGGRYVSTAILVDRNQQIVARDVSIKDLVKDVKRLR